MNTEEKLEASGAIVVSAKIHCSAVVFLQSAMTQCIYTHGQTNSVQTTMPQRGSNSTIIISYVVHDAEKKQIEQAKDST